VLGALADRAPIKKRFLAGFMILGASATCAIALVAAGDWLLALILFGLGQIGATGSFVFYDSLLPHIASEEEADRVSTAGYALGYVGGGELREPGCGRSPWPRTGADQLDGSRHLAARRSPLLRHRSTG
jgi:UMF1 family MFS transporter